MMIPIDKDLLIEIDKLLYELDMLRDYKNSNELRLRLEDAIEAGENNQPFSVGILKVGGKF